MDRRIKKNQTAIMDALIQLMAEKDFKKITINEIADFANVNRGTIYSHFLDKYDLLDKCVEAHLESLLESCMPLAETGDFPPSDLLLRTFELMETNALFYKTLFTNKGTIFFRDHVQDMMKKGIRDQIAQSNLSQDILRKDILVEFLSSATVGVIEWWFTNNMPCSPKEITDQVWSLLEIHQAIPRS